MSIDTELLKKHAALYKINKDTAGEYHKELFKQHKDIAGYYDAEDIDPDAIPKSQKFVMYGMQDLQFFFKLPQVYGDERKWRSALSSFKDSYEEIGMPMKDFNRTTEAFLAAMAKHAGGVSPEQKQNWEALLKQAYEDMKKWGWC